MSAKCASGLRTAENAQEIKFKQAGDRLITAPLDGLLKAVDIVHDLKNRHHTAGYETGELDKLEKALNSMIKE